MSSWIKYSINLFDQDWKKIDNTTFYTLKLIDGFKREGERERERETLNLKRTPAVCNHQRKWGSNTAHAHLPWSSTDICPMPAAGVITNQAVLIWPIVAYLQSWNGLLRWSMSWWNGIADVVREFKLICFFEMGASTTSYFCPAVLAVVGQTLGQTL